MLCALARNLFKLIVCCRILFCFLVFYLSLLIMSLYCCFVRPEHCVDRHISNSRYIISWFGFFNRNVQFYAFFIVFAYRNDHWMLQSRINWNNRTEATLMHILYLKVFKECFRVSIAIYLYSKYSIDRLRLAIALQCRVSIKRFQAVKKGTRIIFASKNDNSTLHCKITHLLRIRTSPSVIWNRIELFSNLNFVYFIHDSLVFAIMCTNL